MLSQELAGEIWTCHREIATGRKLLDDMAEVEKQNDRQGADKHATRLRDAFGRERGLTLGVPSGENSHRILDVAPDLAKSVIAAHIANKKAELVKLNERARIEIDAA